MSEINANDFSGIRWWMRNRSKRYFLNGLKIVIILLVMLFLFGTAGLGKGNYEEILFLSCFFLFFLFFACYQFVLWVRSFKWNIRNLWTGTIIDTHCIRNSKKKIRSYRIIADVNGKTMEGVCLRATYNRAKIGDRILLFTLEGDKVFCVHPDE